MTAIAPKTLRSKAAARLAHLPTGAKVFVILVGALLPLALIALATTMKTSGDANREAERRLQATAEESSGVLTATLKGHIPELRDALKALESDAGDAAACTRLLGAYAALDPMGVRVAIIGPRGDLRCGKAFAIAGAQVLAPNQIDTSLTESGLVIQIAGEEGGTANAFYPTLALAALVRPSGFVPDYGAALTRRGSRLVLRTLPGEGPLSRRDETSARLGVGGLSLEMAMPGAQLVGPLLVATLLLVLMWIAAAAIGWFVVDGLLIRPLRRLRREVSAFRPGEIINPPWIGAVTAQEIRDLGDAFHELSQTVKVHEAGLAEGLVRQTRLTREVHHRVKNNLQVIASLINFHARGANSAEASAAYAAIQRRVDALAVVHRHHYAEHEEHRGLELRAVIGELASNLRATAPETASEIGITLEIEPFLVSQDVAVAVAFLLTELIELAIECSPSAQIRISARPAPAEGRAVLRVNSPALVANAEFERLLDARHGRILAGLARQLRTQLHHDPLVGAYEATIAVAGRA